MNNELELEKKWEIYKIEYVKRDLNIEYKDILFITGEKQREHTFVFVIYKDPKDRRKKLNKSVKINTNFTEFRRDRIIKEILNK